ncbi:hypothetical protein EON66_01720 [archaeon]|nr:MAG: hypothetical protein EON66_01720 [archaeon]
MHACETCAHVQTLVEWLRLLGATPASAEVDVQPLLRAMNNAVLPHDALSQAFLDAAGVSKLLAVLDTHVQTGAFPVAFLVIKFLHRLCGNYEPTRAHALHSLDDATWARLHHAVAAAATSVSTAELQTSVDDAADACVPAALCVEACKFLFAVVSAHEDDSESGAIQPALDAAARAAFAIVSALAEVVTSGSLEPAASDAALLDDASVAASLLAHSMNVMLLMPQDTVGQLMTPATAKLLLLWLRVCMFRGTNADSSQSAVVRLTAALHVSVSLTAATPGAAAAAGAASDTATGAAAGAGEAVKPSTSVTEAVRTARALLRESLLPHGTSAASVPIRMHACLQHWNDGVKLLCEELVWQLCDEDAGELVNTVGIGLAAGLLQRHGALSLDAAMSLDAPPRAPLSVAAASSCAGGGDAAGGAEVAAPIPALHGEPAPGSGSGSGSGEGDADEAAERTPHRSSA